MDAAGPSAPEGAEAPRADVSWPKSERLCGKKNIEELFKKGSSFNVYPYRVLLLADPRPPAPHYCWPRVLVVVPKRRFRRAVDRNLIKRRLREAYRVQKPQLRQLFPDGLPLRLALIYVGQQVFTSAFLRKKLTLAVRRLADHPPV